MRFSSLSSSSSDLAVDDRHLSSSPDLNFTTIISGPPSIHQTKPSDFDLPLEQPPFDFKQLTLGCQHNWMQPLEAFDDFAFDFPEAPELQDQNLASAPFHDFWPLDGQNWYPHQQASVGYNQYSSQQSSESHKRFPSTSSVASGAESQFGGQQSLPFQQYPGPQSHLSPFQQHQQPTWIYDTSSPLSNATQHLPTPIGTPKSEASFQVPNVRRSRPASGRDAALAAAHNSVRSALNQQWKPTTYVPSLSQAQTYSYDEMPRTPQTGHGDDVDTQVQSNATTTIPKLDRTISDAQADELYIPATFPQPPTAPRHPPLNTAQPQQQPSVLQDRLRAANEARSASPSQPSDQTSPWTRQSAFGDSTTFRHSQNLPMQTAASMRRSQKQESDAQEMQHALQQDHDEPNTVSPADAFPEQQVPREDENLPSLFPTDSNQSNSSNLQYAPINMGSQEYGSYVNASMAQSTSSFATPSIPASAQGLDFRNSYYQQQPTVQYGPVNGDYSGSSYSMPAHLTSMETTKSDESDPSDVSVDSRPERPSPSDTLAGGGRYTCPYADEHGNCGARFDTGSELNQHKRDVHRQNRPLGNNAKRATAMTQTGPHRCNRISPTTGKSCNVVFSRPYDLTRHEDTIHGEGRKLKCPHCPEEKLFSRNDALTRHLKVVHAHQVSTGRQRGRRQGS